MASETVEAPLAGKIIKVMVNIGAVVKEGDTLCLIESMKMENPILAPVSGTVKDINISLDQVVKSSEVIAVIEY